MNEMNLSIMSYEDILNWYKPTTDNEKYLLEIMGANYEPNKDKIRDLEEEELVDAKNERDNFERELDDLQNDYHHIERVNSDLEKIVEDLEDNINDYETKFEELTTEING